MALTRQARAHARHCHEKWGAVQMVTRELEEVEGLLQQSEAKVQQLREAPAKAAPGPQACRPPLASLL